METEKLLDIKKGLDFVDNDKKLYGELLVSFIGDKPFQKEQLLSLINAGNNTEAARYVHFFKGAAAQIGADRISSDAQLLCDVLRGKQQGDSGLLVQKFIRSYEQTMPILQETVRKLK